LLGWFDDLIFENIEKKKKAQIEGMSKKQTSLREEYLLFQTN
jgi:hypothetical protein